MRESRSHVTESFRPTSDECQEIPQAMSLHCEEPWQTEVELPGDPHSAITVRWDPQQGRLFLQRSQTMVSTAIPMTIHQMGSS